MFVFKVLSFEANLLAQQDIMENSDPHAQPPSRLQGKPHSRFQTLPLPAPPPPAPRHSQDSRAQPADKVFAVGVFTFPWLCVHSVYKLSCTEAQKEQETKLVGRWNRELEREGGEERD